MAIEYTDQDIIRIAQSVNQAALAQPNGTAMLDANGQIVADQLRDFFASIKGDSLGPYTQGATVMPTTKKTGSFYWVSAGTYTEFGAFNTTATPATSVVPANEVWMLVWDGTKWVGMKFPIDLSGYLNTGNINVIGGIASFEAIRAINNQTTYGSSTDITTTATQIANSYVANDGSIGTNSIFKIIKVQVSKGDVITLSANGGNTGTSVSSPFGMLFLFSSSDVFISRLVSRTTAAGTLETYTATATQDGYMYCNARIDASSLVPSVSVSKNIISKIFAEKSVVDANTDNITANTNAIAALQQQTSVQIPMAWYSDGYINRSGVYVATSDGNYTRTGYVQISDNSTLTIEGSIVTLSAQNNVSYYSAQSEGSYISGQYFQGSKFTLTIPTGAKYLRFSNRVTGGGAFTLTISTKDLVETLYNQSNNTIPNQFAMPAYLDCPIGLNTDIFFDCISQEPDFSNGGLVITGSDSVSLIQKFEKKLRYNPLSTSPASVNVTFKRVDKQANDLYSKSITFRKTARTGGTGAIKNICIAGDSLIQTGSACVDEIYKLLAADGDYTINQIGTRILSNPWGVKHEGRGGWAWTHYVNPAYGTGVGEYNAASNAFMISGKLDFKAYMTNNFPTLSGIDIFYIGLGTNDVQSGLFLATDAQIDAIIANAKTFLNALISDYPNCKIILGMPAVGAPVFSDTRTNEAYFRYSIQKLNMAYVDNFDNGKYNANLTCVMHGAYADRYDGYQHTDDAANDYITGATIRRWTDSIHPLEAQYRSWGRGIYGKIRAILNGFL